MNLSPQLITMVDKNLLLAFFPDVSCKASEIGEPEI